jgi:hypothetical protein
MKKIFLFLAIGVILAACFAAADQFQCTKDCPPPKPGYKLIGCTHVKNHAVDHEEGSHVPAKAPWNSMGYVYIASSTQYDDEGNVVSDEIIACDYWPVNQTLPPTLEELHPEWFNDTEKETEADDMAGNIDRYNSNMENFPGFVKGIFGDQLLHVYFTKTDGTEREYAAITEGGAIVESSNWVDNDEDGNDDGWQMEDMKVTMNAYIDEAAIDEIEESDDPFGTFMEAWGSEIRYEGKTFGTAVTSFFIGVALWIADIFI